MSAEITLGEFVSKFSGAIVAVVAAIFGFVLSHIRLNSRVDAQQSQIDNLEDHINGDLSDLKAGMKDLTKKVDENHEKTQAYHMEILRALTKSETN